MRRLVALLATTARAQTPRRVHGFDVRTKAGHAFKCLDVFIAPAPWNASAPALIGVCHPGHRQLTWAGGRCGFRYASTEMDARVAREAGHEVFACAVPPITSKAATTRLAACAYLCGNQNLTARSSTRRLLDGVVGFVPHRSTEPGRPRHRQEMT